MATVDIINASKKYGSDCVLNEVNLRIEKGEFIAVVGPSGCGKSTLLRLVAGLDQVSSGQILINDTCVNHIHPSQRDIAMVFQSYALYPHMSVFDNMSYALKMQKMPRDAIKKRVQEAAAMLKLEDYLQRLPRDLSGGQRQRVAMGRAIVRAPAVFLFDEPLSNLDAKLRNEMRLEIKKLHQQLNTTCLYVTHDQTEAMTMASRVLVLNQGKVEQIGRPIDLYQRPASLFVASFIGQYPMNFLEVKYDKGRNKLLTEEGLQFSLPIKAPSLLENSPLILGIRPEHLNLSPDLKAETLPVFLRFMDDLGSDKLVHVQSYCGKHALSIRTTSETLHESAYLGLELDLEKAHLFDKNTGLRLEGWDE